MSVPFEGLIFLIVPGFLTVKSNLFSNDQQMGEAMMLEMHRTTRPPHKIFFYENGDRVERIIEDDLGLHPDVPIIIGSQFGNGGFAGREVGQLPQNSSGILDTIPLNNFLPQPTNFNLNKGDGSNSFISQNELPQKDIKEFPTIYLTPQQFFHIKVSIPRAYYTTRVYQDSGDSDILEVISKPNNMVAARAVGNMNSGLPQPSSQQLLSNIPMNMAAFPSQPPTGGWSPPSGTGVPTQRAISGFQPNESPASPYLGSSMLSLGNPGQYNSQNTGTNNFNRPSPDYGGNTQYGGPRDDNGQNGQQFPPGMRGFGQPNSPFQNGQPFPQGGQPFGQPSPPGQNGAQFPPVQPHSFGQPNNQMPQYPNPSQSGGVNDYNRSFQNSGNPVRPSSLFSTFSSRNAPAGVPMSFANADPAFRNTQSTNPLSNRMSQSILNAVRSLDDGTESAS